MQKNQTTKLTSVGDEWRIEEANRRLELVTAFSELLKSGRTPRQAYAAMPVSRASMDRYLKAFEAGGYDALIPGTDKCGRKSKALLVGLTEEEALRIRGHVLDTGSVTSGARLFAHSDQCRPELAEAILDPSRTSKHSIPGSIRAAVKNNAALDNAHRGRRALSLRGMWTPRRIDILPGDIFSSDDTTPIWAWWVPWYESKEYPFGVKALQGQFLPVIDVASQCIITFALIAREASSYRACDIWSLFGHTFDAIGLPRLGWQLERGSWEANIIAGQEIEYQEGEHTFSRRVGGLRQLPVQITDWHAAPEGPFKGQAEMFPQNMQTWTSYLPKSKSIEAAFNRLQTLEGCLWGSLGRNQQRNPFEKTKKIFEACKRGTADPREHFLSGEEMARKLRAIIDYLNNEPMEGEVFRGVPRQVFDQAVMQRPLYRMPEELGYLYRRDWKALQITQGWARVRLTHPISGARYSLFYENQGVFAKHEGEQVVVYYDRENFERPAQVHLARTGEFLCEARYFERVGSFLDGDQTGHDLRRQWRNSVMAIYGTIAAHAPSRQLPEEIASRKAEGLGLKAQALERQRETPEISERGVVSSAKVPRGTPQPEEPAPFKGNLRMQMLQEEKV